MVDGVKKYLYLIIYFLSPIPIGVTLYNSDPLRYGTIQGLLPMLLGSFAFTWLTWQFVISARPKFIERHFGMDKLYRFHGWMAVTAILAAFVHKLLEYEGTFATTLGETALYIFAGIAGITFLLMVDSIFLKIPLVKWIRKTLKPIKILHRRNFVLLHNLTILALILIFVHVMLSSSAQQYVAVRLIYITYFIVGLSFYLIHRIFFAKPKEKQRYHVSEITQESPVMWTLKLENEKGHRNNYLPGQFGFFRFFGKNIPTEEHPFSISSGDITKNYLTVTIKELGDFTAQIKNIKKGDRAVFDGPYGKFSYLNYPQEKESVLVAGGVGITPILSMLRHMSEFDSDRKVLLLWGVNTKSDLICESEMNEIQKKMKNLEVVPVLSGKDEWNGLTGWVNSELVEAQIQKKKFNNDSAGIYVCGPPPMMDGIVSGLRRKDSKKYRIHFEKFLL